jgi:hypothetical protein
VQVTLCPPAVTGHSALFNDVIVPASLLVTTTTPGEVAMVTTWSTTGPVALTRTP